MNTQPMFTPDEAMAEQSFLRDVLVKANRSKWLVLLIAVVTFVILTLGILVLPKTYSGIAMVEADAQTSQAVPQWATMRDQQFSDYTLGSEMTILQSPELLGAIIHKLDLTADPEFNRSLQPSVLSDWQARLNEELTRWLPNNKRPKVDVADQQLGETLNGLLAHMTVAPVPHSRDIQITVLSHDNQKAAQIANAIADAYISSHLDFARQITERVHSYTDQNLTQMAKDASEKAQKVAQFRIDHNIVTGKEAPLLQEQISTASVDLSNASAALATLRGRYEAAQRADPETLGAVLNSPTIERLREQEATVGAQRAGMASNYVANAQPMARLNASVADIRAKIRSEADRMVASLRSDIQAQEANVASLQARLTDLHTQVGQMISATATLVPLQQEADAASDTFKSYASTLRQTDVSMMIPATTVRIVSHASVPYYATFPNNKIMFPAALAFSVCFAGLVGWTRETRRKGIISMNEVEIALAVETLGLLPMRTRATELTYRDAVEQLFNRLIHVENPPKSLLITSAFPQEGKTTTAWSLAQAGAERDMKVLLLDADMRSTRLVSKNVKTIGLGDVIRGQATVADVLQSGQSSSGNLTLLPAGQPRGMPTRLFAMERFNTVLADLKREYDLIIIDAPPTFVGGDCWLLSQKVDRTVFIAKWGQTTAPEINEAISRQLHKSTFAGVVLNMVNGRQNLKYGHAEHYLAPEITQYYRHPRSN